MVTNVVAYTHPTNDWPTMFGKYVPPQRATLKELQVSFAMQLRGTSTHKVRHLATCMHAQC